MLPVNLNLPQKNIYLHFYAKPTYSNKFFNKIKLWLMRNTRIGALA